jgi:hypothetical protein
MSGGTACTVKDHRAGWIVLARRANFSAFNGYRRTPSAWSEVYCPAQHYNARGHGLGSMRWRTTAGYVDTLPDAPPGWVPGSGAMPGKPVD